MKASSSSGQLSFAQKEQICETTFFHNGPFHHVCTPGQSTEILCETADDYKFLVTLIAIAASAAGVTVVSFEVMSNHIHVILAGQKADCQAFFDYFKAKLKRYYSSIGRYVNLDDFKCKVIAIESLRQLRIELAYLHRNAYVVNEKYLPFSYPWSSGSLYFNPLAYRENAIPFSKVPFREKQLMCRGRIPDLPDSYLVKNGMLLPQSFCAIKLGEALFRNAHQYFAMISKNYEAYSEVAKSLGDDIYLDDEEMFAVLQIKSKRDYNEGRPTMLPQKDKLELAKWMRRDYNASNGQIHRMLRLDLTIVEELFGH